MHDETSRTTSEGEFAGMYCFEAMKMSFTDAILFSSEPLDCFLKIVIALVICKEK